MRRTGLVFGENMELIRCDSQQAYVNEHLVRHPEIDVMVTNETAEQMLGVHSSGFNNADMTLKVNHDLDAIADNTVSDRVLHSAEYSTAIATGQEFIEMLRGKKDFPESVVDAVKKISTATVATAITVYLFS